MQLDLVDTLSLLLAVISLLFAAFLFTVKSENRLGNYLIALYLIFNTQDSGGLFISEFVYPTHPGWGMFINSTVFLKMPLIYLYILSLIYSNFKLKKKDLLHLIPIVVVFIVFIPRYYTVSFEEKWAFLEQRSINIQFEIYFTYIFVHIQIVVYLIMCFAAVFKYKRLLLENYSNASLFNFKYLFHFLIILTVSDAVATAKNVFLFLNMEAIYYPTLMATAILTLASIIWIVLKALQNPQLFRGIDSNLLLVKDMQEDPTDRMDTLDNEKSAQIKQLREFMITEEPYLDPSLSVSKLAYKLNWPAKELSLLINHDLNQHFFDFVNAYRIEKAKSILDDPSRNEYTILEILYEVGFNSKSSFNTAFKKHAGLTPTQYRKKS